MVRTRSDYLKASTRRDRCVSKLLVTPRHHMPELKISNTQVSQETIDLSRTRKSIEQRD